MILNMDTLKIGVPNYIKWILTDVSHRLTLVQYSGHFSISFWSVNRSSQQKLNKKIYELYDTISKIDIKDSTEHTAQML